MEIEAWGAPHFTNIPIFKTQDNIPPQHMLTIIAYSHLDAHNANP